MILKNIMEAGLIRANFLLSKEEMDNSIKSDVDSISNLFGIEFDKNLFTILFDSFDFKDSKILINSKNQKISYFLEKFAKILENDNFVNFFAEILIRTKNINKVQEIINFLQSQLKLSDEHLLKILLSFIHSKNPKYESDAIFYLYQKCKILETERKLGQIDPLLSQDIALVLSKKANNEFSFIIKNSKGQDEKKTIRNDLCFYDFQTCPTKDKEKKSDDEVLLSFIDENGINNDLIPLEKIYEDIGPMIFNKNINLPKSPLIDDRVDAKIIADFILNILKKPTFTEDKEIKILNKIFLKSLDLEIEAKNIDDSSDKQQIEWNIENFYKLYKNQIEKINPIDIFDNLDSPYFNINDKKKFDLFLNILKCFDIIKNNNYNIFFDWIFKKWENEDNQINFLHYLISYPQVDSFSFKNYKGKKIKQPSELNFSISKSSNSALIEPWQCISLLEVLLKLSHGNKYVKVKELFEWPIQNIPEIIALGLIQIKQNPSDFLYDELIQEVLTLFLGNHMNSFSVIEEIWNTNKELVINAIANMYNSQPDLMNLSRILDITQKLKDSLLLLVDCNDYKFAVNLGILAVKRDFLHIDSWIKERIESIGDDFVLALIEYINENVINNCKSNIKNKESTLEKSQLTVESLAVIVENLIVIKHSANPKISEQTEETIKEMYKQIFEIFQELNVEPPNSKEIEDIANSIFQSMFKGETKIEEAIEKLKYFKESKSQKDREIYSCMIHCLLDEYRFFNQYPEKQLNIVSVLFGQIINNKLLEGVIETIALKYIFEGIKKGTGSLFVFGTKALQQFVDKLNNYPTYLHSLLDVKNLKNDPILYETIMEKYNSVYINPNQDNNLPATKQTNNLNINQQVQLLSLNEGPTNLVKGLYPKINQKSFSNGENNIYNPFLYNKTNEDYYGLNNNNNQKLNNELLHGSMGNNIPKTIILGNNINQINNSPQINNFNKIPGLQSSKNIISTNKTISLNDSFQDDTNPQTRTKLRLEQNYFNNGEISSNSSNNLTSISINNPKFQGNPSINNMINNGLNLTDIFSNDMDNNMISGNQEISEKIKCLLNQLNNNNINDKAKEMKMIVHNDTNIYKIFNDILLNKICIEENNGKYYELILLMDNKDLLNENINETLKAIKKLLSSKSIEDMRNKSFYDMRDIEYIETLGSWLGKLTLARNKPILAKDLDFRDLLKNALETGKLNVVVPFIARILKHSTKSKVFTLKNPWMISIIGILYSILKRSGLNQKIINAIEELFQKLGIKDYDPFKSNNFLDGKVPLKNSYDFISYNSPKTNYNLDNMASYNSGIPQTNSPQDDKNLNFNEFKKKIDKSKYWDEIIKIFESKGIFSKNFIDKSDMVQILYNTLNESITTILSPVIDRAVNISTVTTKELVIKDFQFEPSKDKFKEAAVNSIKSLAGALALVTAKEPLRMTYAKKIKDILKEKKIDEGTLDEVIKMKNTVDLLNIGYVHIFNYVQKKAADKILQDEIIIKEIERRNLMDINGKFKSDNNHSLMSVVDKLPNSLKPRMEGLTDEQLAIYDNYSKIYTVFDNLNYVNNDNQSKFIISPSSAKDILLLLDEVSSKPNMLVNSRSFDMFLHNIQNRMIQHYYKDPNNMNNNEFEEGSEELKYCENAFANNKIKELKLPEIDETRQIEYDIMSTIQVSSLAFEHKYKKLLNVYMAFLKGWINSKKFDAKTIITNNLLKNPNSTYCFNCYFHEIFFNEKFINVDLYQDYINVYLEPSYLQPRAINLINGLKKAKIYDPINNCLPKIYPFYNDEQKLNKFMQLFGKGCKIPSNLNIQKLAVIDYKICNIKDDKTYELFNKMCIFAFNKIVGTKYPVIKCETNKLVLELNNFIQSPFISNEEQLNVFIMLITELCMKNIKNIHHETETGNFPENEACCIYTLLMAVPNELAFNKLKMFSNIFNGIFKTFHCDYVKTLSNFNQRPYYKFFYNFISLFSKFKNDEKVFNSSNTKIQYFCAIADFLKILSPVNYPGFALAWLDLISCKNFISCFMSELENQKRGKNSKVMESYIYLIMDLLSFFKTCDNSKGYNKYIEKIFMDQVYKFFFLLSESYPEFLCGYHYICIISLPIENSFGQLKNLILSATPKNVEYLKQLNLIDVDLNKELYENNIIKNYTEYIFDIVSIMKQYHILENMDNYIQTMNKEIIKDFCRQISKNKGKSFNFYVIEAVIIYLAEKNLQNFKNINQPYLFIIQMFECLDPDNRMNLIHSILNEIRYPSIQTLYFINIIFELLVNIHNSQIEENIITIIIERLLVKPIPWGIELLFKKLIKGDRYNLLGSSYVTNLYGGFNFITNLVYFIDDKSSTKFFLYKNYKASSLNANSNNENKIESTTTIEEI